jgi:hypothetical protein
MSWIAAAIAGSAIVGAVGSNIAAGTQAAGQQTAANTQLSMFNTINQQEQPFIQAGYGATSQLNQMLAPGGQLVRGFTPQDFLNNLDPGYQFQLQTGGQALRNADTPGVGALSGPALKDLMSFNQGMAATGYQSAFNRFQTQNNAIFSRLFGIAGLGQNAASNVGTSGTQLGTGIAQAQAGAAGSIAGGIVGGTNAISGAGVPLAYLLSQQGGGGGSGTGGVAPAGNYDPYQSTWGQTGSGSWSGD